MTPTSEEEAIPTLWRGAQRAHYGAVFGIVALILIAAYAAGKTKRRENPNTNTSNGRPSANI